MYRDESQSVAQPPEMPALSLGLLERSRPSRGLGASQDRLPTPPPWDSESLSPSCAKTIRKNPLHRGYKSLIPNANDFLFPGANGVLTPQEHRGGAEGRMTQGPAAWAQRPRGWHRGPASSFQTSHAAHPWAGGPFSAPSSQSCCPRGRGGGEGGRVWPRPGLVSAKRPPPTL